MVVIKSFGNTDRAFGQRCTDLGKGPRDRLRSTYLRSHGHAAVDAPVGDHGDRPGDVLGGAACRLPAPVQFQRSRVRVRSAVARIADLRAGTLGMARGRGHSAQHGAAHGHRRCAEDFFDRSGGHAHAFLGECRAVLLSGPSLRSADFGSHYRVHGRGHVAHFLADRVQAATPEAERPRKGGATRSVVRRWRSGSGSTRRRGRADQRSDASFRLRWRQ